ncbi:capsule biosynthesis protein [Amphritea pacifica]|uniref:capsule biosynthesis protein n=1 Tax=Amphritea pacifica TaxID=2811233 RepID=UPI0019644711|nr:capsular biosynthesis protein [Amphritea pacifica]MBN1008324.1 capsular biosynthesis protein [Amphritea pacifica]
MDNRNFIFLQGPTSPFFSRLGDRLLARGARVYRVNFNMGDYVYWRAKPSMQFRKDVSQLPAWLEAKLIELQITDIIMVGDTRPVNAPAVALAKKHDIRLHVFEEGYLRPNFLTLEEDGINGFSPLPKDSDWYRSVAAELPPLEETKPVRTPVALLALHEIGYHLPGLLNCLFYPGYKTHRPYISGIELLGWAVRLGIMPWYEKRDEKMIQTLIDKQSAFFLLPLQLDSDSQIQTHSQFDSMADVIRYTLSSFARHAPENSLLVIKNHPLDTGFSNYRKLIRQLEKELNIRNRTVYLESGHLPTLLDHCQGTIVVNSTVGTSSLIHKRRTITLADPVYNIPGLTSRCSLDQFWCDTEQPDMHLFHCFRKVVRHTTQINGGFYSREGVEIGVDSSIERLLMNRSPLQTLFGSNPLGSQQLLIPAQEPQEGAGCN